MVEFTLCSWATGSTGWVSLHFVFCCSRGLWSRTRGIHDVLHRSPSQVRRQCWLDFSGTALADEGQAARPALGSLCILGTALAKSGLSARRRLAALDFFGHSARQLRSSGTPALGSA